MARTFKSHKDCTDEKGHAVRAEINMHRLDRHFGVKMRHNILHCFSELKAHLQPFILRKRSLPFRSPGDKRHSWNDRNTKFMGLRAEFDSFLHQHWTKLKWEKIRCIYQKHFYKWSRQPWEVLHQLRNVHWKPKRKLHPAPLLDSPWVRQNTGWLVVIVSYCSKGDIMNISSCLFPTYKTICHFFPQSGTVWTVEQQITTRKMKEGGCNHTVNNTVTWPSMASAGVVVGMGRHVPVLWSGRRAPHHCSHGDLEAPLDLLHRRC